jgi:hypothetical protein
MRRMATSMNVGAGPLTERYLRVVSTLPVDTSSSPRSSPSSGLQAAAWHSGAETRNGKSELHGFAPNPQSQRADGCRPYRELR